MIMPVCSPQRAAAKEPPAGMFLTRDRSRRRRSRSRRARAFRFTTTYQPRRAAAQPGRPVVIAFLVGIRIVIVVIVRDHLSVHHVTDETRSSLSPRLTHEFRERRPYRHIRTGLTPHTRSHRRADPIQQRAPVIGIRTRVQLKRRADHVLDHAHRRRYDRAQRRIHRYHAWRSRPA